MAQSNAVGFCMRNQIVEGWKPVDLQDGANTADAVSMSLYNHCSVVFMSAVGTGGDDPTLTILQGTDAAFATNKALNFTTIWRKQAATDLSATGVFTRTTQTAANTYTHADAAEQDLIWVVEFDAQDLDLDGGYTWIRASVADVGNNAQLGVLFYILSEPRFPQSILPSAIA